MQILTPTVGWYTENISQQMLYDVSYVVNEYYSSALI